MNGSFTLYAQWASRLYQLYDTVSTVDGLHLPPTTVERLHLPRTETKTLIVYTFLAELSSKT